MSRLTWDGTAEPVSRNQNIRREWGQGNIHFPCSADHEQDWQPRPVDSCYCCTVCVIIHTYIELGCLLKSGGRLIRGYTKFDFTVDEGKERLNPSREKN